MKTSFTPGRYGKAFKNGKFYEFAPKYALVVAPWPNPRAWLKRPSHGWRHTRKWADRWLAALFPKGTVYEPAAHDPQLPPSPEWVERVARREHDLFAASFDLLPDSVRAELLRYDKRRWHLLNLLARCPGADDLCRSNPALAYALASNWVFHKPAVTRPMRAARALVNRKQKVILEWLGFPATEPVRRILAKIATRSLSVEALLYLRSALTDPWVLRTLAHLPRINAAALRLATDPDIREHVTPRLVEDVGLDTAEDEARAPVMLLFWDTLRMARHSDWQRCPRRFASLQRLQTLHDELAVRLGKTPFVWAQPLLFPPPPFAGTPAIVPLRTPRELWEEGAVMRHCAGSRYDAVAAGRQYIYRVLTPVRATLAIYRRGYKRWGFSEIRGVGNSAITPEARKQVMDQLLAGEDTSAWNWQPDFPAWEEWLWQDDPPAQETEPVYEREPEVEDEADGGPVGWDEQENAARIARFPLRPSGVAVGRPDRRKRYRLTGWCDYQIIRLSDLRRSE